MLGTPFLIRYLQRHNIGAQIRDDGPVAHPHEAKAGTPTMGGVAIVGAAFVGYLVAHINSEAIKFADTAIALWVLILGLFAVGFVVYLISSIAEMNRGPFDLHPDGQRFAIAAAAQARDGSHAAAAGKWSAFLAGIGASGEGRIMYPGPSNKPLAQLVEAHRHGVDQAVAVEGPGAEAAERRFPAEEQPFVVGAQQHLRQRGNVAGRLRRRLRRRGLVFWR